MDLFSDPTKAHLDVWGGVLIFALCAALAFAIAGRIGQSRLWKHHPYRQEIGRHVTTAAFATSILLSIAVASHLLGSPVYGKPILGVVALTLFVSTIVVWRTIYLSGLRGFETRWPATAEPRAKMLRAKFKTAELPYFAAAIGACAGYVGFIWHPWNHAFHEGMWILGALVGLTGGCLYLVVMADTARLERAFRNRPPSTAKTHRR